MGRTDPRAGEKHVIGLARAVVYRFLARCLSYPDMELTGLFTGDRLADVLDSWSVLGLDASAQMKEITTWLESAGPEASLDKLEVEYTRLFVNAYPRIPAPPYSSVYLDKDRQVWGPSTAQAGRFYEEAGLSPSEDFADIPDHISAELEFISYLILEQQKLRPEGTAAGQDTVEIEGRFLADHFLKWVAQFLNQVVKSTENTFYGAIAHLALRFVELETIRINSSRTAETGHQSA